MSYVPTICVGGWVYWQPATCFIPAWYPELRVESIQYDMNHHQMAPVKLEENFSNSNGSSPACPLPRLFPATDLTTNHSTALNPLVRMKVETEGSDTHPLLP